MREESVVVEWLVATTRSLYETERKRSKRKKGWNVVGGESLRIGTTRTSSGVGVGPAPRRGATARYALLIRMGTW